jgi:hypothetical protein
MAERLEASVASLGEASCWLLGQLAENRKAVLAGATPYARAFGLTAGGAALAKGALAATRKADGRADTRVVEARHFAESVMGETTNLAYAVRHGHETVARADVVFGAS